MAKKLGESKLALFDRRLLREQKAIRAHVAKFWALRRKRPKEFVEDFVLTDTQSGKPVRLSELFGKKNELIVVHNMGAQCVMCTMWADGFNGQAHHLEDRAAFVLCSGDPVEKQRAFAGQRGWKFRMVSSQGSTFTEAMGFRNPQDKYDGYSPGISTFAKTTGGKIYRVTRASIGPGDEYNSGWNLMDLLPKGRGEWFPKYQYARV